MPFRLTSGEGYTEHKGVCEVETINGFTVIADKYRGNGDRVILGVRVAMTAVREGGFEYVTAVTAPRVDEPRTWNAGHYTMDLADAVESFTERAK